METLTEEPETIDSEMEKVVERIDIEAYTEQDYKNKASTLNHYIQHRDQVGRAAITKVPLGVEVTTEFVSQNVGAVNEIIKVRKECKKCNATDQFNCRYNTKEKDKVEKVEDEKGLERGTITPDSYLFEDFYWKNSKTAIGYTSLVRPTLLYHKGKLLPGYEKCPIAQTEEQARKGTY